jgi:hypothetical protein
MGTNSQGRVATTIVVLALSATLLATTAAGALSGRPDRQASMFSDGSVELSVSPASAAVSFDGMAPGDRVTAPLTVRNGGTLPLRYVVTSTATNDDRRSLATQLDLTLKAGVAGCSDRGFASSGDVLYGPGPLGSAHGIVVVGGSSDRWAAGRILDAADSERLCIRVELPSRTGNAFQGASTSATFTFQAIPVTDA